MRQKKIQKISCLLILVMIISLFIGHSVRKVNAQGVYDGYVYITVEKVTLGQGLILEPVKVGYQNGDSAADVILNAIGIEKAGFVSGYLSYIVDNGSPQGWTLADIPDKIINAAGGIDKFGTRQKEDRIGEFDYTDTSGWMYSVNNEIPGVGIGSYRLGEANDGDVIRLQFTVYGYGADLIGSNQLSVEPLCTGFPGKLDLICSMAEHAYNKLSVQYQNALTVMSDWDATADDVQDAVTKLESADYTSDIFEDTHSRVTDYIHESVTEPGCYSIGGEWAVLSLARSDVRDVKWYKCYYDQITAVLEEKQSNKLHGTKSTENSRAIIALTAIGADPTEISGYNLLEPLADYQYVGQQGINGYIYALIAMDCGDYDFPDTDADIQTTRDKLIAAILDRKTAGGGWSLDGETADADITAMAVQALAPYYNSNSSVKNDIDEALEVLSGIQKEHGEFANTYVDAEGNIRETVSSESCAQVLCALSALGIDVEKDERFIKNGSSVLDALLSYYDGQIGGFKHEITGEVNQMATEQAAYALTAYRRLKEARPGLYQMSDAANLYQCPAHIWDNGVISMFPTTTAPGKVIYTCLICGDTKTETVPMLITTPPQTTEGTTGKQEETTASQAVSVKKPGKTQISKVKSPRKKQIKVTWKKKSGVTGYQIQVSTTSKFTKSKTKTYKISKQKTTSKTIKSLKSKKKYYVRIRTYKTAKVNGGKVTKYSSWSAKKTVRVK